MQRTRTRKRFIYRNPPPFQKRDGRIPKRPAFCQPSTWASAGALLPLYAPAINWSHRYTISLHPAINTQDTPNTHQPRTTIIDICRRRSLACRIQSTTKRTLQCRHIAEVAQYKKKSQSIFKHHLKVWQMCFAASRHFANHPNNILCVCMWRWHPPFVFRQLLTILTSETVCLLLSIPMAHDQHDWEANALARALFSSLFVYDFFFWLRSFLCGGNGFVRVACFANACSLCMLHVKSPWHPANDYPGETV